MHGERERKEKYERATKLHSQFSLSSIKRQSVFPSVLRPRTQRSHETHTHSGAALGWQICAFRNRYSIRKGARARTHYKTRTQRSNRDKHIITTMTTVCCRWESQSGEELYMKWINIRNICACAVACPLALCKRELVLENERIFVFMIN